MSDNFKIIGIGGAGVNTVKALGYSDSVFIDSGRFNSIENAVDYVRKEGSAKRVVIVSSPSGGFSSSVLKAICYDLSSAGDKVLFIGIMPFHSESIERQKRGRLLLNDLRKVVDSSRVVENENFASSMSDQPWVEVLGKINGYVGELVKGYLSSDGIVPVSRQSESSQSKRPFGVVTKMVFPSN